MIPQPTPQPDPLPSWPMLRRRAEQLMQVIYTHQKRSGWCFASQSYLGELIGIKPRQVRNLVRDLHGARWLLVKWPAKTDKMRTCLMRVRLPQEGPLFGTNQPRQNVAGTPRQFIAAPPGKTLPPIKYNTSNEVLGGNPPSADASAAPLFAPPARVNLWAEHRDGETLGKTLHRLFGAGMVGRVRRVLKGKTLPIVSVQPAAFSGQMTRILTAGPEGRTETITAHDDALVKMEFYP